MGKSRKPPSRSHAPPDPPATAGVAVRALKWIGAAAAVISLVLSANQLKNVVAQHRERRAQIARLLATDSVQVRAGDFRGAWSSLEQASQLDQDDRRVQTAHEELAMRWLEEVRLPRDGATFTEVVAKLEPVLARGIATSHGVQRKADLIAHFGWAQYLRAREGTGGYNPDALYEQALATDPNNAYAHAMLGHWLTQRDRPLDSAMTHFAAALRDTRAHSFARRLELAALLDRHDDASEEQAVRVANEMRGRSEPLDDDASSRLIAIYYRRLKDLRARSALLSAVPPREHALTLEWLFGSPRLDESKRTLRDSYLRILRDSLGPRSTRR
jgi:Tfp pilus assembly protein PilF